MIGVRWDTDWLPVFRRFGGLISKEFLKLFQSKLFLNKVSRTNMRLNIINDFRNFLSSPKFSFSLLMAMNNSLIYSSECMTIWMNQKKKLPHLLLRIYITKTYLHVTLALGHLDPCITYRFFRRSLKLFVAEKSAELVISGWPHRGRLINRRVWSSIIPVSGILPNLCSVLIASFNWVSVLRLPVSISDFGR